MAFNNIRALLDTYANCISLLKSFGRGREDNGTPALDTEHEHSRLRKALKSDRSLIKRAYSSQLSESGSRLKKGDGERSLHHHSAASLTPSQPAPSRP